MVDVLDDVGEGERRQLAAYRDPLLDLPHLRQAQVVAQLRLPDQHHLQQLLALFELGENANLLDDTERQVLRLVDDQDRERLQRHERVEEFVERVAEILA